MEVKCFSFNGKTCPAPLMDGKVKLRVLADRASLELYANEGEFVASSQGLGYLMIQVQSTLDTAAMFMAVILLSLLGIGLFMLVLLLERLLVVKDARLDAGPA